jgi:hypothetical protein
MPVPEEIIAEERPVATYAQPLSRLQVSWGSILAGALAMLAVSLILWALCLAVTLSATSASVGSVKGAITAGLVCHRRAPRVPLSAGSPVPRDPPADLDAVLRATCRGPRARVVKALADGGAPEWQVLSGEGSEPFRIQGCALR